MSKVKGQGKQASLPQVMARTPVEQYGTATSHSTTRTGVRKEEDLSEGNNEKAEDLTVIIVTLAADWFHKEQPARKLPNRNSLDCQLHEGRTHLYSQCLAPCFLCHGHKTVFVERTDSIRSIV